MLVTQVQNRIREGLRLTLMVVLNLTRCTILYSKQWKKKGWSLIFTERFRLTLTLCVNVERPQCLSTRPNLVYVEECMCTQC